MPPVKGRGKKKYPAALHALPARPRSELPKSFSPSLSRQQEISLTRKTLADSRIRLSAQPVSPVPGNRGD